MALVKVSICNKETLTVKEYEYNQVLKVDQSDHRAKGNIF
jgi:hypothetical protein